MANLGQIVFSSINKRLKKRKNLCGGIALNESFVSDVALWQHATQWGWALCYRRYSVVSLGSSSHFVEGNAM